MPRTMPSVHSSPGARSRGAIQQRTPNTSSRSHSWVASAASCEAWEIMAATSAMTRKLAQTWRRSHRCHYALLRRPRSAVPASAAHGESVSVRRVCCRSAIQRGNGRSAGQGENEQGRETKQMDVIHALSDSIRTAPGGRLEPGPEKGLRPRWLDVLKEGQDQSSPWHPWRAVEALARE